MPNTDKTILLPQLQRYDQKIKGWADNKFLTKVDAPSLPPATATTLGGVKVGNGLNVTSDGTLSTEDDIVFTWDFDTSAFSCNKTFAEVKRIVTTGVRRTATANGIPEGFSVTLLVGVANDNAVVFFGTAPTDALGAGMLGSKTAETITYLFQDGLGIMYTSDGHIQKVDLSNLNTNMSFDFKNTTFQYDQYNSFDLKNGGITSAKLADSSVTAAKIASSAVTSDKITNGAVSSAKLALNAVTADKIADSGITSAKLADGAVTSAKIADGAITADKLASGVGGGAEVKIISNFLKENSHTYATLPDYPSVCFLFGGIGAIANLLSFVYCQIDAGDYVGILGIALGVKSFDAVNKDRTITLSTVEEIINKPFPKNIGVLGPGLDNDETTVASQFTGTGNINFPYRWNFFPKSTSAQAVLASLRPVQDECEQMEAEIAKLEQDWIDNSDETVAVDGNGVPITIATKKTKLEKKKAELEKLREDYISKLGDWKNEVQE